MTQNKRYTIRTLREISAVLNVKSIVDNIVTLSDGSRWNRMTKKRIGDMMRYPNVYAQPTSAYDLKELNALVAKMD